MNLSVIVPALNEEKQIGRCLSALKRTADFEVIVVDGGSRDQTVATARSLGFSVRESLRGLAVQCNFGAEVAKGDLLFFVSADSIVPPGWQESMFRALSRPTVVGGGFRLRLDSSLARYRVLEWGGNFRSRYLGITLPDQGLFVRRSDFLALGGLDSSSLIPHAKLSFQLKRRGEFVLLPLGMQSSVRKWEERGLFPTTWSHIRTYLKFKHSELPTVGDSR